MMRIKEAIQRKKLIHEMNEEWKDFENDIGPNIPTGQAQCSSSIVRQNHSIPRIHQIEESEDPEIRLNNFVIYLSGKLTDLQKRALKITWKRLSEAPKTSGRGTLHIMEKVLTKLSEKSPGVPSIFYKSAFLSCIEDRKCGRTQQSSIATIRDHAHILITLIDDILHIMFEGPLNVVKYDPYTIGEAHSRLGPLGFEKSIWHVFGECFAEVMFMQECIRAYPHAPSAWSLLAVALTDRIFSATKLTSSNKFDPKIDVQHHQPNLVPPPVPPRQTNVHCPYFITKSNNQKSFQPAQNYQPPMFSTLSLDLKELNYDANNDEDVFWSARSEFVIPSCPFAPSSAPQRKLPSLGINYSNESNDTHFRKTSVEELNNSMRNRNVSNKKFIRSKSETRLKIRKQLRSAHDSTDV